MSALINTYVSIMTLAMAVHLPPVKSCNKFSFSFAGHSKNAFSEMSLRVAAQEALLNDSYQNIPSR